MKDTATRVYSLVWQQLAGAETPLPILDNHNTSCSATLARARLRTFAQPIHCAGDTCSQRNAYLLPCFVHGPTEMSPFERAPPRSSRHTVSLSCLSLALWIPLGLL